MNNVTLNLITEKLRVAPQSVLDRVSAYLDVLVETLPESKPYQLTSDQQKLLDEQVNLDKKLYVDAEVHLKELRIKHEL
jgi:hypothetical protein